MTLEPLKNWVIGRIAITKVPGTIVLSDVTKNVTKFVVLEAVSEEAGRAGYKPGDIVLPKAMHNIFLQGGSFHRVTFPIDDMVCRVRDVPLNQFVGSDGKELKEEAAA